MHEEGHTCDKECCVSIAVPRSTTQKQFSHDIIIGMAATHFCKKNINKMASNMYVSPSVTGIIMVSYMGMWSDMSKFDLLLTNRH